MLPLSPQALEEVRELQNLIAEVSISSEPDIWTYPWGKEYTSSKFYKFCFKDIHPHISFLWLWKSKSIPRVKFFCWLVLSDRLNTRNMLKWRQFALSSGYNCLMCTNPLEEMIEHVIFHCPFSYSCWQVLGVSWQASGNRLQILEEGKARWNKPLFMDLFMLASWNIWKERNKIRLKIDLLLLVHKTKSSLHPFIFDLASTL
jgi:hypothetical protein